MSRHILHLRFPPAAESPAPAIAPTQAPEPPAAQALSPARAAMAAARVSASARAASAERWHGRIAEAVAALRQAFPGAFRPADDPGPWPPLKIGAHKDVLDLASDLALPRRILRHAVNRYCRDWRYRAGHVEGAVRVGLDGAPAGVVTAEQAAIVAAGLR